VPNTYIVPNALNGSLVLALKKIDPKSRIVCLEIFPFYIEHLKNNLKVEAYKIDSASDLMLQLTNLGIKMNIDWKTCTVLMNAPYQEINQETGDRKDQASHLWGEFIYTFAELVPRMTSVQPSSWLSPSKDFSGKRYERFADEWRNHFKTLNIKECSRHFEGVGSHFTYFTLDKTQSYPLTKLITEKGSIDYPFCNNTTLGYDNLVPNDLIKVSQIVHPQWRNDFGFSRQGYNGLKEKNKPYAKTGIYPFFHTNKQKNSKPSTKSKKKQPSYMNSVITVAEHEGIKATFTYSNIPHPQQFKPKVMISLSGNYNPILDKKGCLGYTSMVMPIICETGEEAQNIYDELKHQDIINSISSLKWNGFINIEVLMRLICKDRELRTLRKSNIHAYTLYGKINKKYTKLTKRTMVIKHMELTETIKEKILKESQDHYSTKMSQDNSARRASSRTDKTGEVFTPSELVIEMLESLPLSSWNENEHHVDPAMGNGQFLAGSAIVKAELNHTKWLETIFGVDLMPDNVAETKNRLIKIAINYGYDEQVAKDIVNENLHIGNTLDPESRLPEQSDKDYEFMNLNFKPKKDCTLIKKIKKKPILENLKEIF